MGVSSVFLVEVFSWWHHDTYLFQPIVRGLDQSLVVENIEPRLNNEKWAYKRQYHICYIFIGTFWIIYFMLMIDYIRHRLNLITLIRINVWLTVWIKAYISSAMYGKNSTQELFILINRLAGNIFLPRPVSILWLSQVSANERRCCLCNIFTHLLKPGSTIDRKRAHVSMSMWKWLSSKCEYICDRNV